MTSRSFPIRWLWLALCLASIPAFAPAADKDVPLAAGAKEVMVPMRDGTKLATNIFLPKDQTGPFPTVVTRTPYSKDKSYGNPMIINRYISAGYAYVTQDCRGKFHSEGNYSPFETDRQDGYDTIEWIAKQDFCNGKIGISGPSAMGITGNLAAVENPPHLVCAFVVVAPESMSDESTFIGGVFKEADVGKWMQNQGAGDEVARRKSTVVVDDYWKSRDFIYLRDRINIPIYNVGGWYDIFSKGSVNNFAWLQNHGREGAKGNQKLLMGPFGHGDLSGNLAYPGDRGLIGAFNEEMRWFNHWLKGEKNGIMEEPPVTYFMMAGAKKGEYSSKNGYRKSANWPLTYKETRYYVSKSAGLSTEAPKAAQGSTAYAFDPANPVKTYGGANLTIERGPMDQRAIGERADYLRFSTEPLANDVTIAGPVTAEIWASTDGPDTDFMAKLVDVYPDGYEAIVLDAPLRARYRHGREPKDIKMMEPGKPELLKINLWQTSLIFEKGHRIALHVTSSNSPRFEVNPNTGEAPGKSEMPPRVAHNTVYHDAAHPTALVLPVLDQAEIAGGGQ